MAGVFRKAMVWLGLAPDDEYDDYGYDDAMRRLGGPGAGPQGRAPGPDPYGDQGYDEPPARTARPAPRGPVDPDEGVAVQARPAGRAPGQTGTVRPLPARPGSGGGGRPSGRPEPQGRATTPTVRPMRPSAAKPTVVEPESFDDAKAVADRFKAEQPVVMDLSGSDRDLARRLIDFASGICYALSGHMERLAPGVYLLTPPGVEVSDEERRRLSNAR